MLNASDLHGYQNTSVEHILYNDFAALFLDMGLGKTVSALTAVDMLIFQELEIDRVLVIAPKRVAENVWTAECKKWSHLKGLKISVVTGTPKQRLTALMVKADIYTIGRDNVPWLCGQYGGSMLPFDMVIIDESSSFKNPKSLRFKALRKVQPSFKRVVLLTGTPAPNGLIDLWSQLFLLDRGERLGQTITEYRTRYFSPGASNGHIVFKYNLRRNCEEQIHKKIGDICISMKAEDYLDLPGVVETTVDIPFPSKVQKLYDQFERDQVLSMFEEGVEVSAVNAAALSNKLQQFANGAVYDEDKNYHVMHDLKLDALQEIVEEAQGRPVLVAYAYKHDLARVMDRLKKYKPVKLDTGKDIKDWNAGKIQVMVMHPASGGHGLNLQEGGNIVVWFGLTWSLELLQQFNARLARQGQKQIVSLIKLAALSTVDKKILASNERKATKQEGLMEAVKAIIKKYI